MNKNRQPSQRQLRVGEEIRHVMARILAEGEVRDPDVAGASITVTEARPSPDLRAVTLFVMPLGGGDIDKVVAGLNRAAAYLRGRLGKEVDLRFTPSLRFMADRSFDQADRVAALLGDKRVREDLERAAAEEAAGDETGQGKPAGKGEDEDGA